MVAIPNVLSSRALNLQWCLHIIVEPKVQACRNPWLLFGAFKACHLPFKYGCHNKTSGHTCLKWRPHYLYLASVARVALARRTKPSRTIIESGRLVVWNLLVCSMGTTLYYSINQVISSSSIHCAQSDACGIHRFHGDLSRKSSWQPSWQTWRQRHAHSHQGHKSHLTTILGALRVELVKGVNPMKFPNAGQIQEVKVI